MSDSTTWLGDRYELLDIIGRGGMAEVHRAYDTRLGRDVAVKILRSDHARDASFLHRFRREAQSSASLNHPAIVAVYDTGEEMATDGSGVAQPYIVMERIPGDSLRPLLDSAPLLDAAQLALLRFAARYYQHPIGEVVQAALPVPLREGRRVVDQATPLEESWSASSPAQSSCSGFNSG